MIPVYNRPSILVETLKHVLRQTHQPSKLVIVDDGSTDDTASRAERWLQEHAPEFEYLVLRMPKTTASDSRKVGFEEVSSLPYVAFLDSDDHWPADFLERCVAALGEREDAVAAIVDRDFLNSLNEKSEHQGGEVFVADPIPWIFKYGAGIASCSLLRSDAYVQAGGWPVHAQSSEDVELFSMISLLGNWVHVPGEAVQIYVGNSQQLGEDPNLSRKRVNSKIQWAYDFESIYKLIRESAPDKEWDSLGPHLSYQWSLAGKSALKLGDKKQARVYYRNAIRMNPYAWKACRRLARCLLG